MCLSQEIHLQFVVVTQNNNTLQTCPISVKVVEFPLHILHYDIIVTIVIIKIIIIIKFSVLETIVIILVNFCFLISFEW